MSNVNPVTDGQLVMNVHRARELVDKIRDAVSVAAGAITEAYRGRAWEALGYESWDALCDAEFGGVRVRIPREERRELVGQLRQEGMSTTAIGIALGISDETARRDASSTNVEVERVMSLDGRLRPAFQPPRQDKGAPYQPEHWRPDEPRVPTPQADAIRDRARIVGRLGDLWHNTVTNLIDGMKEAAVADLADHLEEEDPLGNRRDRYVARLEELRDAAATLHFTLTREQRLRRVK